MSLELNLAVEMGYKVVKIHVFWYFQERTNTLFRGYIDMFLKKKQKLPGGQGGVKRTKTKRSTFKSTKTKKGSTLTATPFNSIPSGVEADFKQFLGENGSTP